MNNWFIWLIILTGILGPLLYLAGTFWKLFLGWRTPITWISALPAQGRVEVVGRVRGETTTSPLRKSESIYWQLEVQEYHGGRGGGWHSLHKKSSGPFEINDMTGRINIKDAEFDFVLDNELVITNLGEAEKTLLESLGIKAKGLLGFDKKLRIFERTLTSDEEILVLGRIQRIEGQISFSGGSIVPQVISNLSKGQMLKTLFWRDVRPRLFSLAIGLVFIILYLYNLLR